MLTNDGTGLPGLFAKTLPLGRKLVQYGNQESKYTVQRARKIDKTTFAKIVHEMNWASKNPSGLGHYLPIALIKE